MNIIPLLKEIGRGAEGARSLTVEQSRALFLAMQGECLGEMELGAALMALRMKGESLDEMTGFYQAASLAERPPVIARMARLFDGSSSLPIILPTYNGTLRGPNLTPLLGLLYSRLGANVIFHGPGVSPQGERVMSADLLKAWGVSVISAAEDLKHAEEADTPPAALYFSTDVLFPALSRLLKVRERLGLRNAAHSLVKMLDPFHDGTRGRGLVLSSATHPAYLELSRDVLKRCGGNALVFRATEGEPFVNLRRDVSMEWVRAGESRLLQCCVESQASEVVPDKSREGLMAWMRDVLAGRRPIPEALRGQLAIGLVACGLATDLKSAFERVVEVK